MDPWYQVLAEPKLLIIVGLGLDVIGAWMVALTAWSRVHVHVSPVGAVIGVTGYGSEPASGLKWRRRGVVAGGALLMLGFGCQIWGTWLQMP